MGVYKFNTNPQAKSCQRGPYSHLPPNVFPTYVGAMTGSGRLQPVLFIYCFLLLARSRVLSQNLTKRRARVRKQKATREEVALFGAFADRFVGFGEHEKKHATPPRTLG